MFTFRVKGSKAQGGASGAYEELKDQGGHVPIAGNTQKGGPQQKGLGEEDVSEYIQTGWGGGWGLWARSGLGVLQHGAQCSAVCTALLHRSHLSLCEQVGPCPCALSIEFLGLVWQRSF